MNNDKSITVSTSNEQATETVTTESQAQNDDSMMTERSDSNTRIEPTLDSKIEPHLDIDSKHTLDESAVSETQSPHQSIEGDNNNNIDQDAIDDAIDAENQAKELAREQAQKDFEKAAKKRFFGSEKIRPFIYIGAAVAFGIGGIGYYIVDKATTPEEAIQADNKSNFPKTRAKSDGVMNSEQAEYMKQQQEQAASQAQQNGDTYISGFINEQNEIDTFNSQPIVQPGIAANNQQFFDKSGNSYTYAQAAQLSAQNTQIEGVTYGQGSIQDQRSNGAPTAASQGSMRSPQASTQLANYTPYTVTAYVPGTRTSSSGASSSLESEQSKQLDKAVNDTSDWQNNYLALRQKKAQLVDQKAQKAFENQVTSIIESIKPPKNGEVVGSYQVQTYKTSTNKIGANYTNGSTTQQSATNATQSRVTPKVLARTGDTFKAILKTKVNTDEGNDVLATITTGSLKGATLIGVVKPTNDNVQITFTKLLRKGKPELALNAVARSLDGNSLGMADSIQRHHLQKYSSLVTASLLSGVGQAYQQTAGSNTSISNGTVVTTASEPSSERILGNAAGELGNQLSSDIRSLSKRPTTYIINQGKVFNLFLNADLVETESGKNGTQSK